MAKRVPGLIQLSDPRVAAQLVHWYVRLLQRLVLIFLHPHSRNISCLKPKLDFFKLSGVIIVFLLSISQDCVLVLWFLCSWISVIYSAQRNLLHDCADPTAVLHGAADNFKFLPPSRKWREGIALRRCLPLAYGVHSGGGRTASASVRQYSAHW